MFWCRGCIAAGPRNYTAGGRIVLVGLFEKPVSIDPNLIVFKDLKLISSQPL
jgi:threonine dehydrogenase-like Zn-dependent dehydrogenase